VDLVQVDVVGAEPAQALLDLGEDRLRHGGPDPYGVGPVVAEVVAVNQLVGDGDDERLEPD
jgi:hypothetical protein